MQCIYTFLVLTITTFVFINSFTIAKVNNKLKNTKNENWFLSKLSFNRQSIYNYHQNSETTCKKVDYCLLKNKSSKTNKKICDNLGLNCISNENTDTFECICDKNNTRWDVLSNNCLPQKIECKINESFKVVEGKPGCYCNNGYLKQNNTCVEHDPCNNDRQLSPCKDINAKCNKIGLQKTDFQCKCTKNYYNVFENKNSLAKCLPIQCKHCEQTCKLDIEKKSYNCDCIDKTKYKLEKDKCILKQGVSDIKCRGNQTEQWINKGYPTPFLTGSSCACPQNFYFDNQRKVCEIQSQVDFVFGCSKVELKSDKLPGCVCLLGQKFDFLTRKCLMQCDEKSEKFCQEREGQCVVSTSKVKCQCKPGFAAFSADLKNTENFICLNKCMLFNRPELTQYKCYKMFSQCDPTKVTYSGPLKEIFIFNISKITSAQIDHCKCEIGFQFDKLSQECVPSLDPVQYIKDMDFLLDSSMISQSKKRLHTETIIKQAFISLIITLFEKINLESVKCQPSGDKAICTAAIYTKMTIKKVKMKLENACQFLSKTNMCYYMTKQSNFTKNLVFESVLKRTKNEVFIEPINYCSNQNRCSFATYSNCQTKIINSIELFECICNSTIFTVTSQTNIRLFNQKDSLRMQNCQLKDLCNEDKVNYGCEDQSATCHLTAEMRRNQYIAKSFCSCPSTGLVLPDQKRKCANSCDRYCLHGNCTTDILSGTMICQCQNGFSGPRCNFTVQEIQTNKKVSKGYKIATIIFLVIISLTLICVIFGLVKNLAAPSKLPLPLSVQLSHSQLISGPTLGNLSDARIVGGVLATEGEVPHQIALLRNGGMWCGGSLIGPRTVLTAAHCVFGSESRPSIFKVRYSTLDNTKGFDLAVSKISRHPNYSSATVDYDLAILTLEAPFTPSTTAAVIALAEKTPSEGTLITVTGWGRLAAGGAYPTKLQKADTLKVMSRAECASIWVPLGASITEQMFCAISKTQSSCNADSGGPATHNGLLLGAVSWGSSSCLHATHPNVYADVASLREWIVDQIL